MKNKDITFLLLLVGFFNFQSIIYGQSKPQSKLDKAYYLYYKANNYQASHQTDSANRYFLKAAPELFKRGRYTLHTICLSRLAKNYFEKGNYEASKFFIDSVLNTIEGRKLAKVGMPLRPLALEISADAYLWKSKIVEKLHLYDLAMQYANKAVALRIQIDKKAWAKIADAYLNEGKIQLASGYYSEAVATLDKTLEILQKNKSKDTLTIRAITQALAENYQKTGDYEKALVYLQKSVSNSKDSTILALNFHIAGLIADGKGDYDSAAYYHEKSLTIWQKDSLAHIGDLAKANLNIGISNQKNGQYDRALAYEQKALFALEDTTNQAAEDATYKAAVLDQLGVTYASKGDIDQAIQYQEKALAIRQEKLPANHPEKAENLLHLGDAHFAKKEYEKASLYYQDALKTAQKSLPNKHPLTAAIYCGIGMLSKEMGQDSLAKAQLNRALHIYLEVLHTQEHAQIAKIYHTLSLLSQKNEKWQEAIQYTLKSIQIYEKVLGAKHPSIAEDYYNLGVISENQHQDLEAMHYYQQATIALTPDFEDKNFFVLPSLEKVLSETLLLKILGSKGNLLKKCSLPNESRENCLQQALMHFELATDLIEKMRNSYKAEGSKFFLAQHTVPIYEEGIKLCLQLFELTQNKNFYQEAFVFSEKSKAGVLRSAIADVQARKIAGVPDSLLSYEQSLHTKLQEIDKDLSKEETLKEMADKEKVKTLKANLFENKTKYDRLIAYLEKTYPKYHDLKYKVSDIDFAELENSLKKDKRKDKNKDKLTLIEYFVGTEKIYIFTISEKGYHVTQVEKSADFERNVKAFRGSLYYKIENKTYEYGIHFYKQLIEPVEKYIIGKRLMIIPDAVLGIISFEALIDANKLAGKKTGKDNFAALPYLLKKYNFSYTYSSMLLMNQQPKEEQYKYDYLAFAPIFRSNATPPPTSSRSNRVAEDNLAQIDEEEEREYAGNYASPLLATEQEVDEVSLLFSENKRVIFKEEKATEEVLKSLQLKDYKYIHFATHGFVNTQNPALSGIMLYKKETNQEDGILHSSEVYNLKLNTDLVVLSACETGLGKVIKGEGVIGLSRSFLYAGAKNMMVSLWKVNDEATKELVVDFYQKLEKGKNVSKAEALRKAKLNFLKSKKYAMPYYWNGFVLISNSL
ncbi:MAG: CHAT domain-containing protein [Cytophagales bacterium]|nr:MAG: CHAT domain-containing protein [Cytophagales bacterium]